MDQAGKKGGKKGDFADKALENDKVRDMEWHLLDVEDMEQKLNTSALAVSSHSHLTVRNKVFLKKMLLKSSRSMVPTS